MKRFGKLRTHGNTITIARIKTRTLPFKFRVVITVTNVAPIDLVTRM